MKKITLYILLFASVVGAHYSFIGAMEKTWADEMSECSITQLNLNQELYDAVHNRKSLYEIKELVKKGADVNFGNDWHTILEDAVDASFENDRDDISITQFLLESGANPNAYSNHEKWTALHYAAAFSSDAKKEEIIKLLVAFGADINAQTKFEETVIHKIMDRINVPYSILKYLLSHPSFKINSATESTKYLRKLSTKEAIEASQCIKLLFQKNAQISAAHDEIDCPLSGAIRFKSRIRNFSVLLNHCPIAIFENCFRNCDLMSYLNYDDNHLAYLLIKKYAEKNKISLANYTKNLKTSILESKEQLPDWMSLPDINNNNQNEQKNAFENIENNDVETHECTICFDTIEKQEKYTISCGHNNKFHQQCVAKWLETNKTCPFCRTEVTIQEKTEQ